jgi:hypothetical protein
MPNLLFCPLIKEFVFGLFQTLCDRLHLFFMPNQCCNQCLFMMNCYILHFLHHSGECAIHNHKVLLQSLQSHPCFLLLFLSFFQLLLSLIKLLIQLSLSKHEPYIILLPLLLMGFKLQGINPMFNTLSFVHYYALQMFQLQGKLLNYFPIGTLAFLAFVAYA